MAQQNLVCKYLSSIMRPRLDDILHFFYDAQSRPSKVDFNGTMYTYVHNLQGDIAGCSPRLYIPHLIYGD